MPEIKSHQLTVIIPFHNFAKNFINLKKLIKKAEQVNFKTVIVADALTNGEIKSLRNFAKKRNSVKVVSNVFRSAALSRNEGLKHCKSKWIAFWDCDDDIVIREYLKIFNEKNDYDLMIAQIIQLDSQDSSRRLISCTENINQFILTPAFTRIIYKRKFIDTTIFPNFKLAEDQGFISQLMIKNPSIIFINNPVYIYRLNNPFQSSNTLYDANDQRLCIRFILNLINRNNSKKVNNLLKLQIIKLSIGILKNTKPKIERDYLKNIILSVSVVFTNFHIFLYNIVRGNFRIWQKI